MQAYIVIDVTTGKHTIGVLANTAQGALAWCTKNGFYNRFNRAYLIGRF